jgi:DNA-directed RNA polymerase subunit M/transcription elongation factor TFIIS
MEYNISIMHFCSKCQNMYYIRINADDSNQLEYYCRSCGNCDSSLVVDNISVSKTHVHKNEQSVSHLINKYTKFDPTLPRIRNILCPNEACKTNTAGVEREIIYIRYDDTNMKYIYLCSECDNTWKTN